LFYPDLNKFKQLAKRYNIIPVYKEILSDYDTPVSTFHKLAGDSDYAYLLESVEGTERWGRYSFISSSPRIVFIVNKGQLTVHYLDSGSKKEVKKIKTDNPMDELKRLIGKYKSPQIPGLPRFWGGAVGYIGYEMVCAFENRIARFNSAQKDYLNIPESIFMFTDSLVIFDHFTHKTKLVSCVDLSAGLSNLSAGLSYLSNEGDGRNIELKYRNACSKIDKIHIQLKKPLSEHSYHKDKSYRVNSNMTKKKFLDRVKDIKKYIRAGDVIQTVMSQQFSRKTSVRPFDIYRTLRTVNPSPYMYYLNMKNFQLIGSSPEILVRKEGDMAETRPIAGTRPRGRTPEEENRMEKELVGSPKECAEHIMLVDLGRNDLGRVCEKGSVKTNQLMTIEKYSHVMHLVSSVAGKLSPKIDAFELLRACFPAGTVTGAPKIRAMEIIGELEPTVRGPYAGAIGYFSYSGNMDMAITIRTILMKDSIAYVQAGAGIVADSLPEHEYQETENKAKALFSAIDLAERVI